MEGHTEGPWTVQGKNIHHLLYDQPLAENNIVATVPNENPESIANSLLIAAAPELLEACRGALQRMIETEKETGKPMGEGMGYKGKMQKPVVAEKLRAAIARAEGRA